MKTIARISRTKRFGLIQIPETMLAQAGLTGGRVKLQVQSGKLIVTAVGNAGQSGDSAPAVEPEQGCADVPADPFCAEAARLVLSKVEW